MSHYRFTFLDKAKADETLPVLFALLHENMSRIAPSGLPYEEELALWLRCVAPALRHSARQILLLHDGEILAGYLQYYVNGGVFMVEEIQLKPAYQRTLLLLRLCQYLATVIPDDTVYIEAYAHKKNLNSQALQRSLGMVRVGIEENGILHFRGDCQALLARFR